MITPPLASGKSHRPWVAIQKRCAEASAPLQPGRKLSSDLQEALDLDFLTCFAVSKRTRQLRPTATGSISPSIPPSQPSDRVGPDFGAGGASLSIPSCGQEAKIAEEGKERMKKKETHQPSLGFDQGPVLPVHFVIESTGVTQIVPGAVSSPQRG